MSRQSVFDRLGPPNDDGSARLASEEVAAADTAAAPKQRVALAHPLVARQLQQVAGSRATAVDHSKPQPAAAQPLGQRQRRRRQQPGCSSSSEEHTQRQTSSSGVTGRRRRQPANPAHGNEQLQEEMQRLLAEREAAEEALGQMALQTQALLADRQALAAQAAQLASQKEQLEEQLEYLLQDQEWASGEEEDMSSGSQGSTPQPSTPSAVLVQDAVAALQGRLEAHTLMDGEVAGGSRGSPS